MVQLMTIIVCQLILIIALCCSALCWNNVERENFAAQVPILPPGLEIDKNKLDPEKWYQVGIRTKSNTLAPAEGGAECVEYPETIYKEVPAPGS